MSVDTGPRMVRLRELDAPENVIGQKVPNIRVPEGNVLFANIMNLLPYIGNAGCVVNTLHPFNVRFPKSISFPSRLKLLFVGQLS